MTMMMVGRRIRIENLRVAIRHVVLFVVLSSILRLFGRYSFNNLVIREWVIRDRIYEYFSIVDGGDGFPIYDKSKDFKSYKIIDPKYYVADTVVVSWHLIICGIILLSRVRSVIFIITVYPFLLYTSSWFLDLVSEFEVQAHDLQERQQSHKRQEVRLYAGCILSIILLSLFYRPNNINSEDDNDGTSAPDNRTTSHHHRRKIRRLIMIFLPCFITHLIICFIIIVKEILRAVRFGPFVETVKEYDTAVQNPWIITNPPRRILKEDTCGTCFLTNQPCHGEIYGMFGQWCIRRNQFLDQDQHELIKLLLTIVGVINMSLCFLYKDNNYYEYIKKGGKQWTLQLFAIGCISYPFIVRFILNDRPERIMYNILHHVLDVSGWLDGPGGCQYPYIDNYTTNINDTAVPANNMMLMYVILTGSILCIVLGYIIIWWCSMIKNSTLKFFVLITFLIGYNKKGNEKSLYHCRRLDIFLERMTTIYCTTLSLLLPLLIGHDKDKVYYFLSQKNHRFDMVDSCAILFFFWAVAIVCWIVYTFLFKENCMSNPNNNNEEEEGDDVDGDGITTTSSNGDGNNHHTPTDNSNSKIESSCALFGDGNSKNNIKVHMCFIMLYLMVLLELYYVVHYMEGYFDYDPLLFSIISPFVLCVIVFTMQRCCGFICNGNSKNNYNALYDDNDDDGDNASEDHQNIDRGNRNSDRCDDNASNNNSVLEENRDSNDVGDDGDKAPKDRQNNSSNNNMSETCDDSWSHNSGSPMNRASKINRDDQTQTIACNQLLLTIVSVATIQFLFIYSVANMTLMSICIFVFCGTVFAVLYRFDSFLLWLQWKYNFHSPDDKDHVLSICVRNGWILNHVSNRLQDDKDVVFAACLQNWILLQYVSSKFQSDRDVVLVACQQNGNALLYAAPILRMDKEIVLAAAASNPQSLKYALDGLNQDPDCLIAAKLWDKDYQPIKQHHDGGDDGGDDIPMDGNSSDNDGKNDFDTTSNSKKIVLSTKFSLGEDCSSMATEFAVLLKQHPYISKGGYTVYSPNTFGKSTCDPHWTRKNWPCRGTFETCRKENPAVKTGVPTSESCWRYSFRYQLEEAKRTNGFMIQLVELYNETHAPPSDNDSNANISDDALVPSAPSTPPPLGEDEIEEEMIPLVDLDRNQDITNNDCEVGIHDRDGVEHDMEDDHDTNIIIIQEEEYALGKGQSIETEMANDVGVKIFRVYQPCNYISDLSAKLDVRHIDKVVTRFRNYQDSSRPHKRQSLSNNVIGIFERVGCCTRTRTLHSWRGFDPTEEFFVLREEGG